MADDDSDLEDGPSNLTEEFEKARRKARVKATFKICFDFCDKYICKLTPSNSFTANVDYDRDKLLTEIYNDKFLHSYTLVIHTLDFIIKDIDGFDVDKATLRRKKRSTSNIS